MIDYPACFSNEKQYKDWRALALKSTLKSMNICTDCSPEYQSKMVGAMRCQSPDANVVLLQLREMDADMHQDVIKAKLETFNDPWANMLDQLTFTPLQRTVQPRSKKGIKNVRSV